MAEKLKAMFVIVDRCKAGKVEKALTPYMNYGHTLLGRGTAGSDLTAVLGVGETDKAVLIFTLGDSMVTEVYGVLKEKFSFLKEGAGIAFTAEVAAVGGEATLAILTGKINGERL